MLVLVGPEAVAVGRPQVRGEVQVHQLGGEARARCRSVASLRHVPARIPVSSSSSRGAASSGSSIEPSSRDVERAGRDLEQRLADGDPVLADEQHAVLVVDREDRDGARVPDDVARAARAVGPLDRVDPERQVPAAVEDPRVDDALDEIGPGGIPRGRWVAVVRSVGQAATAAMSGARVSPVSPSNRCSLSSGRTSLTMSPGLTRCSDPTIATTSWSAALTWRSSSLPRYSTTSARARNDAAPPPSSPMSRCSGRKPATSVLPALRRRRLAIAGGERDRPVGRSDEPGRVARALDVDLDEVHRRAADEAGDEPVDRGVVEGLRRADLLEQALAHDRDPRAHRHRLDLVVGDVDDGRLEALVEPGDLGARLDAQLGVEVGEGLVHEEHRRLADDRPTERDALALAAGELLRLAVEQLLRAGSSRPPR